ncbi:MAG TPA: molybdopterin-guanine dinucleotide biosynthesis protein B [Candidatus Sulfotelmatobacter sp.]|nr:molybdopterin-guanine dinucleotide biosynthesis protein B [Candidatus Sulfotelmatobacter sp.]
MNQAVVAVVGTKKSGKTTTIERLIRELSSRGYKVAAIKHVSEPDHTIDTQGKDTWRYAQAGAKTIVSVATNEIVTIEKRSLETVSIDMLLEKCMGNDIIFIEGLKKKVAKRKDIAKIVVTKTMDESADAIETYEPILAFSGPYSTKNLNSEIPYENALENSERLVDIIETNLLKK